MRRHRAIWSLGALAIVGLCQCSLAFDLSRIDVSGGADANGAFQPDARTENTDGEMEASFAADAGMDVSSGDDGAFDAPLAQVDARYSDGASEGASLSGGLVAFYPFDESNGTTAADASGNGHTATLLGGATFVAGLQNNALSLDGNGQYVSLPAGIVSTAPSATIAVWVKVTSSVVWSRIFDFGSGTNTYMFLTSYFGSSQMRFAITTSGYSGEQRLDGNAPATGSWAHVALTLNVKGTATLYLNGSQIGQTAITITPSALGSTTQNWLGRSEYGDPYFKGQMDNLRIYDRALTSAEIRALVSGHL